jgi:hypothetical protein
MFATLNRLSLSELRDMAAGAIPDTITDMDFLETLAAHRCFVVPPWVMHTTASGRLTKLTRLVYTTDGDLDKARVLLLTARSLRQHRNRAHFGRELPF